MTMLSTEEKEFNQWWLNRFDSQNYKVIRLYKSGKKIEEYTTANKEYSDIEDAECAFLISVYSNILVDQVSVDGKKFGIKNKRVVEVEDD